MRLGVALLGGRLGRSAPTADARGRFRRGCAGGWAAPGGWRERRGHSERRRVSAPAETPPLHHP